ncbi:MAG TPA: CBS domain-containing protein [Gemmatimonadales bacterium]|nr:CBS domain-containing protein [Gemmatimonadales bacterium]
MIAVKEVMHTRPLSIGPRDTIAHVVELFERDGFNAIPVVDERGRLLGIVTQLEILHALRPAPDAEPTNLLAVADMPVERVMRRGVIAVEPNEPLLTAADIMLETRLRSLPVIERDKRGDRMLVGIVSQGDLLGAMRAALPTARLAVASPAG